MLIMLGTNDAFLLPRKNCASRFVADYVGVVQRYQALARPPRIVLAISPGPNLGKWNPGYPRDTAGQILERCPPKGGACPVATSPRGFSSDIVSCHLNCDIPAMTREVARRTGVAPPLELTAVRRPAEPAFSSSFAFRLSSFVYMLSQ